MADKGIKVEWIDSDTPGVIGNKVYRDDVEIADVGMGVGIYLDPTALENVNYKYEVQAYTSTAESTAESLGVNVDYYMISTAALIPIMNNFRIEEPNTTRVFFDAPLGSVEGIDYNDFTINGKTITGVNTTDNYFTLSANLTYWDYALTIRQENGNGTVHDFSMVEIVNYISEPEHTYIKYVDNVGGGNGDSVGSPWSISQANAAVAGTLVYIKAGLYDDVKLDPNNNGSQPNPIKYVGYKTTPGDLDEVWIKDVFDYVDTANANTYIDPNEWPVFRGTNVEDSSGIRLTEDYIIIKNIQVEHYHYNVWSSSGNFISIQNTTAANGYDTIAANVGSGFYYGNTRVFNIRTYKCVSFDNSGQNYYYRGEYHLFEDNSSWGGDNEGNRPVDYYLNGYDCSFNVIKNNYVERSANLSHGGHGIGFKNSNTGCEYNLIIGNDVRGLRGEIYYAAHQDTAYNVFKENYTYGADGDSAVLIARNGAHHNLYENNKGEHCKYAIYLWANSEDQPIVSGNAAADNIFRNNKFIEMSSCVTTSNSNSTTYAIKDNQIYGNTFYEEKATVQGVFWSTETTGHELTYSGNTFKNNLLVNLDMPLYDDFAQAGEFEITYGNFFNNQFATPSGTGNVSFDPQFENTTDLVPTNDALIACPQLDNYDYSGDQRFNPTTYGGEINPNEQGVAPPVVPTITVSNTEAADYTTVQAAVNAATTDDIIGLKGGDEFFESVSILSKSNITLTSYGTGKAIIKSDYATTGSWTDETGGIWSIPTDNLEPLQVFKDGDAITNAKYPATAPYTSGYDNYLQVTSNVSSVSFICSDLIDSGLNLVGAKLHMLKNAWELHTVTITDYVDSTGQITIDSSILSSYSNQSFFMNDSLDFLSNNNDWYYSANKLYIKSAIEPTGITITTDNYDGLYLRYANYINVLNIEIRGFANRGIYADGTTYFIGDNIDLNYNYNEGIYVNHGGSGANHFTIQNSTINGCGHGYRTNSSNDSVINNTITDIGLIQNMTPIGYTLYVTGTGVFLLGEYSVLTGNTMDRLGYHGVYFRGSNNTIDKNYINNNCQTLHDGAGIYTYQINVGEAGAQFSVIEKNTILNDVSTNDWSREGIYLDDRSHDITIQDNNISGGRDGIYLHNTKNCSLLNNKVYNVGEHGLLMREDSNTGGGEDSMVGNIIDGNDYFKLGSNNNDLTMKLWTFFTDVLLFGTFNNNIYYGADRLETIATQNSVGTTYRTLSNWQSYASQDANSSTNTVLGNEGFFAYNETATAKDVALPTGTWDSIDGTITNQTGSITIAAYSSEIMIKQETLGSELVVNGNFDNGDTGWTVNSPATITGGKAVWDGTQSAVTVIFQDFPYAITSLQLTFDLVVNAGGASVRQSSGFNTGRIYTSGSYSFQLTSINENIVLDGDADFDGSIDNVSAKEIL